MALAVRRDPRMRVAEFSAWVAPLPAKEHWELLDGEPTLMAPQSERYQLIVFNLACALASVFEPKGCRAPPGLGLLNDFIDDYAAIPDVVVRYGPLLPDGSARDPIVVAEVLSPSTMNNVRGRKAAYFETLQTLRIFLIVYQDEMRVKVWRRQGADWTYRAIGADGVIDLPEFDGQIDVDAIYANISSQD